MAEEEEEDIIIDEVVDVNGDNITMALGINGEPDDVDEIDMTDINMIE